MNTAVIHIVFQGQAQKSINDLTKNNIQNDSFDILN